VRHRKRKKRTQRGGREGAAAAATAATAATAPGRWQHQRVWSGRPDERTWSVGEAVLGVMAATAARERSALAVTVEAAAAALSVSEPGGEFTAVFLFLFVSRKVKKYARHRLQIFK
jgi:hypothetical protein